MAWTAKSVRAFRGTGRRCVSTSRGRVRYARAFRFPGSSPCTCADRPLEWCRVRDYAVLHSEPGDVPFEVSELMSARVLACLASVLAAGATGGDGGAVVPAPWNDTGHRLVALIAWQRLAPDLRDRLGDLLRRHPRLATDLLPGMPPEVAAGPPADRDRWLFLQAAVWPDLAGGLDEAARERYHRPTWHWVNEPLFLSPGDADALGDAVRSRTNLERAWRPGLRERSMNIVQALHKAVDRIRSPNTDRAEKALFLSWLLHLVGDLHQPLHSTALFTGERFVLGDRGGNRIRVRRGTLHGLWDGALGRAQATGALQRRVESLQQAYPAATGDEQPDFGAWADESHALARRLVYSGQILDAVAAAEAGPDRELPRVDLPDDYVERMREVAGARAVLAGVRLARVLGGLGL